MSYQVLARKWRPKSFEELVGQTQTSRALINALESQRLHHAYLFTGTRGVGKTTIARILSKSLNCETGITSKPCGECSSCTEIDQGCFVDLMEIDAASKTKVEDTRDLLDNVQYRPTRGRYKVYLIDEVHMLSGHSFNALLKTLEEPPPHVIFLLATTDPQKLPVTVLSRCLQFHLKRMEEQQIVDHLSMILKAESIDFEEQALAPIAKGADGSMRDGLSLLDQAIAFTGDKIRLEQVLEMLGSIDQSYCFQLLDAICASDAARLLAIIQEMSQYSPDYFEVMSDWLSLLHKIAVAQATSNTEQQQISELANTISAADLQLFYQLSLQAKKDMAFAPHPRQGFEMAMLRVIAFRPAKLTAKNTPASSSSIQLKEKKKIAEPEPDSFSGNSEVQQDHTSENTPSDRHPPNAETKNKPVQTRAELTVDLSDTIKTTTKLSVEQVTHDNWHLSLGQMRVDGNSLQLLLNSLGCYQNGQLIVSHLKSVEHFLTDNLQQVISNAMLAHFESKQLKVKFECVETLTKTPKERQTERYQLAMEKSHQALVDDVCVVRLMEGIGASVDKSSLELDDKESIIALV